MLRDPGIAPREQGRLYCFSSGNLYAAGVAGVALGITRGMIIDFTNSRQRRCRAAPGSGYARTR